MSSMARLIDTSKQLSAIGQSYFYLEGNFVYYREVKLASANEVKAKLVTFTVDLIWTKFCLKKLSDGELHHLVSILESRFFFFPTSILALPIHNIHSTTYTHPAMGFRPLTKLGCLLLTRIDWGIDTEEFREQVGNA
ncbi:hypothetical protein RIF29_27323 [Crotalaria pallida]|uniref:Uncharacterized protein n=1 Tax=Crotalaria pallida TaxID=3830 RepID=A0AAN9ER20_CROPI